ncbi:MAG: DUF2807 domain-containing protein [Chitinophagaceae bacterium]|nr:MAG: DUF2807 domain-containing protein [Chitinophagaceae bacterium]
MKRYFFIGLVSLTLFSSCRMMSGRSVRGDGNVTSQTRNFRDFDGVDVSGALDVYISTDSTYSVKVEADQNLQEFIEVYIDNHTLRIKNANNTNIDPSKPIRIYVTAPDLNGLGASGASSIFGTGRITSPADIDIDLSGASKIKADLKAPKVSIHMSGACSGELTGETKDLDIEGSGASDLKAFGLLAENVDIDLSGAGSVDVYSSVKLMAGTSGAGTIRYKGAGAVSTDISGAGSVKKVD